MGAIIRGLPFDEYLAIEAEHFSTLKELEISPLHYRRACEHERRDTSALRLGRLVHTLILTPDLEHQVAVYEGPVRRGRAWEAFAEDYCDSQIVTRAELDSAQAMRAAVLAHPIAGPLLKEGEGEVTLQWEAHGLFVRGRLDWLTPRRIVELKSTRMIEPRRFAREFAQRLYHVQPALYSEGYEAATGHRFTEPPIVIVVENQAPWDVDTYTVGDDALEAGRRKADGWLRTVAECKRTGVYPGVGAGTIRDLLLPDWAMSDGLEDIDLTAIGGTNG